MSNEDSFESEELSENFEENSDILSEDEEDIY